MIGGDLVVSVGGTGGGASRCHPSHPRHSGPRILGIAGAIRPRQAVAGVDVGLSRGLAESPAARWWSASRVRVMRCAMEWRR